MDYGELTPHYYYSTLGQGFTLRHFISVTVVMDSFCRNGPFFWGGLA